jgi:alanine racemase
MLVGGVRCPIVGRVSMDLTTLDISGVEGALVGDEAVVLGTQGDASIDAVEVAEAAQTIAYEILTNVSRRVPRVYRNTAEAQ